MSAARGVSARAASALLPSARPLALSVIVPVHQGRDHLVRVLAALAASELARERWELIVVDDASTDGSAEIAAGYADLVVRLTGLPRGPAYARNRGVEVSRGENIAFVDSDVLVQPQALGRMLAAIASEPGIGAVMGSYDAERASRGLVSEYRNLLRHAEHSFSAGEDEAFSAGLALVRRDALVRAGLFDEWHFQRPQAEALELGDRLRGLGWRLVRLPEVRATHLKRWTLRQWIGIDLLERGVSVARLSQFPELRTRADRLYVATSLDALLAWMAVTGLAVGGWRASVSLALLGLTCAALILVRHFRLFTSFVRERGVGFAFAAMTLHVVTCGLYGVASALGRLLYHAVGEPQPAAVVQAFAEVGVRTWPPVPAPRTATPSQGVPRFTGGSDAAQSNNRPT